MPYNPNIHHRRSIRLRGYDYTQAGAYFITICTHQRQRLFGEIVDGQMHLNLCGQVVISRWQNIPRHFACIKLDEFVLMPDHLHGIIAIGEEGIAFPERESICSQVIKGNAMPLRGTETNSLGAIVQNFKSVTTRKINQINRSSTPPLWQRNYHERIIRDEIALQNIRHYIAANPLQWQGDRKQQQLYDTNYPHRA
jgi:REP element-mobilizing transposase RayT